MPSVELPNFVSLYDSQGAVAARSIERISLAPPEETYLPPAKPLHSDSAEHELQVFWAFETGRIIDTKEVALFCLENVFVTPEGIAFLDSGECILETIYPLLPNELAARFPEQIAGWSAPDFAAQTAQSADRLNEAVFLREPGETGYFHWINSVLPRIAVLDRVLHLKKLPLLAYPHPGFAAQSLACFGLADENVYLHDRPVLVSRLWITTPCIIEGDHFTRAAFWTRELRRALKVEERSQPTRVIYLSRSDASVRRISNEPQVETLLSTIGAEAINMNGLSFNEQITLFAGVKTLISLHGAGLSNSIFMPSGFVFEIVSRSRLWPTFRTLASRCGLAYGAFVSGALGGGPGVEGGNEDVEIDLRKLGQILPEIEQYLPR